MRMNRHRTHCCNSIRAQPDRIFWGLLVVKHSGLWSFSSCQSSGWDDRRDGDRHCSSLISGCVLPFQPGAQSCSNRCVRLIPRGQNIWDRGRTSGRGQHVPTWWASVCISCNQHLKSGADAKREINTGEVCSKRNKKWVLIIPSALFSLEHSSSLPMWDRESSVGRQWKPVKHFNFHPENFSPLLEKGKGWHDRGNSQTDILRVTAWMLCVFQGEKVV